MQKDTQTLARELHDVVFAWVHNLPAWDYLRDEERQRFTDRATSMVAAGWKQAPADGVEVAAGTVRRAVNSAHARPVRFTREEAGNEVGPTPTYATMGSGAHSRRRRNYLYPMHWA